MQRRIRIKNDLHQEPTEHKYVIIHGVDTLRQEGIHSIESYINDLIVLGREELIFRR